MSAGLEEDDTVGALTLFRRSLSVADDPNRDPRVAIAVDARAGAVVFPPSSRPCGARSRRAARRSIAPGAGYMARQW